MNNIQERMLKRIAGLEVKSNTVFMSYSWESNEHKVWVAQLVDDLRSNGFDVVRDEDEVDTTGLNPAEMAEAIGHIMSLSPLCQNILLVNTPTYVKHSRTEPHAIPGSEVDDAVFGTFTNYNAHYVLPESQIIFQNFKKFGRRIIAILRDGEKYVSESQGEKFPMIDFRDDSQYMDSLRYLTGYLREPLPNPKYQFTTKGDKWAFCNRCDLSFPYPFPPPKICRRCVAICVNERWLCPRCGWNKFGPLIFMNGIRIRCFQCGEGFLHLEG